MMTRKNKKLLALLLMAATAVHAEAQTLEQALTVEMRNGDKVSFAFADRPTLRFVGDSLVVNAHMYQIAYAADKVQRYTFGTTETDGISQPAIGGKVVYGDNLTLNLGEANATVCVYTTDGKTVVSATANEQGTANIPLSSLPAGVYIVKSGDFSTKILKR